MIDLLINNFGGILYGLAHLAYGFGLSNDLLLLFVEYHGVLEIEQLLIPLLFIPRPSTVAIDTALIRDQFPALL
jgi:hypothetical protein